LRDAWADTTTPHGRLIVNGLAEFERRQTVARASKGHARARGVLFGGSRKLTPHQASEAMKR
jgi:DNA invertase Pin-like site-specific DNA recombinase